MSRRNILSLGYNFFTDVGERLSFYSDRSLIDADLIILNLAMDDVNPRKDDNDSFIAARIHWEEELLAAVEAGKTIFVFLSYPNYFNDSGANILSMLPFDIEFVHKSGKQIVPGKDIQPIRSYWDSFAQETHYDLFIEGDFSHILLTAKDKKHVVGAIAQVENSALVLLPSIKSPYFNIGLPTAALIKLGQASKRPELYQEAKSFNLNLINQLVQIDKVLRSNGQTPPPDWIFSDAYKMERETAIETDISKVDQTIAELESRRDNLVVELLAELDLKRLLYETGHPLEEAVIEALHILGFTAENYQDAESEFDNVFSSAEGRFLGEAEGKDNSAINIEKLRQLKTNLDEDYEKENVTKYAKGVLFGNAYRLTIPTDRRVDFFTPKCMTSAKRAKIALVRTTDLFHVAKYLKEHPDPRFAKLCRKAIKAAEGSVVKFPLVPQSGESLPKGED